MANKFNQYTSGGEGDSTNGSLDIWGFSLRASNLDSNTAIKSNSIGQLISSNLNISDVNNLQSELDATIQNPNNSVLVTDGLTVTTGNILKTDEIHESTIGAGIGLSNTLFTNDIIVTGGNEIKTNNIGEASLGGGLTVQSELKMNSQTISDVNEIKVDTINSKGGMISVSFPSNINTDTVFINKIRETTLLGGISILNDVDMNSKELQNCDLIKVDNIQSKNLTDDVVCNSNLDMVVNEIKNVNNITAENVYTNNIFEKTVGGDIFLNNDTTLINHDLYDIKRLECGTLGGQSGDILVDNNLNINNNNILNVNNLQTASINNVVYVRSAADLPTPSLGFHPLANLTQYVIVGAVLLTNGLDFSAGGCAVTGIDMGTSSLVFDETANDIVGFYGRDANIYVSNLTIVGGGGHFADSVDGLFDCTDYNLADPAPFYGRNRRFRVQSCNILFPYRLGRVVGFGTLNCNNNFINGGGGAPSGVYTIEGFKFSGGLSLEFIGNKVVLFAGAQIANSGSLLILENNVSPVLGFNAVVITSNIIHPRSTEKGITFQPNSTTQLGTISGNTLIRTGGSGALIDYTDQNTYDNYNQLSVKNFSINGNAGVVDSEPNLKSAIGNSVATTAVNPTRTEAVPTFNDQVLKIDSSARFAVQVNLSGGTQAVVANERLTDNDTLKNFLILAVDPAVGVSPNITQTVYLTDMSATPAQIPNPLLRWTSPSGGDFSTATFTYRYRYSEKDPRRLVTVATFTMVTGNNEQYFIAPGNGVADVNCEVSGIANASGVGGTVSLSCTRVFSEGDIINFFVSSAGGSATNISKGIINIK